MAQKKRTTFITIWLFISSNAMMLMSSINLNQKGDFDIAASSYSTNIRRDGPNFNITLHQAYILSDSLIEIDDMDDNGNNSFSVDAPSTPSFETMFTNISIEDITLENYTMVIEDAVGDDYTALSSTQPGATSFTVVGEGYLENVSVFMDHSSPGNDITLKFVLYNSTWNESNSVSIPGGGEAEYLQVLGTVNYNDRETVTLTYAHAYLNNSLTENNTWFIGIYDETGAYTASWGYERDSGSGSDWNDETRSLTWTTFGTDRWIWNQHLGTVDTDFNATIGLAPLDENPNAEDINLMINATQVTALTNGSAYWSSTDSLPIDNNKINFTFSADWWNVECNITGILINYTRNGLNASSKMESISNGQEILWNLTRNGGFNEFNENLSNYYINFTIPSNWDNISVYNGSINKSSSITSFDLNNGYKIIRMMDAENGTDWFLNGTSENLLQIINIYKTGTTTSITEALNTDVIEINGTFSTLINQSDGEINLTAYSPDTQSNYQVRSVLNSTFSTSSIILIDTWNLSSITTDFGLYRLHIAWYNGTDGGLIEKTLTVNSPSDSTGPGGNDNEDPPTPINPVLIILIIVVPIGMIGLIIFLFLRQKEEELIEN